MNWTLLFAALAIFTLILLFPRLGMLAQYKNYRTAQERALVEDALKHLLDRKQGGDRSSPESLSGALGMRRIKTIRLVERMENQGLVETHGGELTLTGNGERLALHITRAHRLWERYLADEARMPLRNIHTEAHRREHTLTDVQLDELDAALGHPTHDPHGDPIPTRTGALPRSDEVSVTAWQGNTPARIVHIEDEPELAYQQIVAAGLRLGQKIRVLERLPQCIVLSDGESEFRLAPVIASNVHVAALPENELLRRDALPLTQLPHNRQAEIVSLDEAVQGFTRRRFLDLGLTPGTVIYPELQNFFGDPRAYRVRGTLIALRKDQAAQIWVRPLESTAQG